MKRRQLKLLDIVDTLAIITFVGTFTPLVMPKNQVEPDLAGIPYTMWIGFVVSIVFVVLAYLASVAHQKADNNGD